MNEVNDMNDSEQQNEQTKDNTIVLNPQQAEIVNLVLIALQHQKTLEKQENITKELPEELEEKSFWDDDADTMPTLLSEHEKDAWLVNSTVPNVILSKDFLNKAFSLSNIDPQLAYIEYHFFQVAQEFKILGFDELSDMVLTQEIAFFDMMRSVNALERKAQGGYFGRGISYETRQYPEEFGNEDRPEEEQKKKGGFSLPWGK